MTARRKPDYFKIFTHLAALSPMALLVWDWSQGGLGYNPIEEITHRTGRDALTLLLLSLSCSPLSKFLGITAVLRIRRTLGVYAFVYASLHFLTFVGLDYGFNLDLIVEGIFAKPFALVGFTAFMILLPLAITSTNGWKRRLRKNWKRLHRLVYLAAVLVIIHFLWSAKQDFREPLIYGAIVIFLLALRLPGRQSRTNP